MTDFPRGFAFMLEGLRLIQRPRLRRFVLVPLLVNLLLFAGLLYAAYGWFQQLMAMVTGWLPAWLDWLQYLLWPLLAISALLIIFYSFTLVANLIAAPFNGLLAEAVEKHLTDQPLPGGESWKQLLKELPATLLAEVQKLLYFVLWAIPVGLTFLIPGLNLFAPFLWALFSAWMLALEYLDPPLGNHGLLFKAQRARARERRLLTLGFGTGAMLMTMIPVLNFIAMPAAVAGATALWVKGMKDLDQAE
ncbi:sulfate transporter CysZ [Thiohalobacter sp. COW1]|uniref:Sulfate transporter CysZ n=1 Tax=Thiohalobacter thiocyanaticus TaxID=585455 RepID=A0A1Z4VR81_9GAMM|nr:MULTISPECIES: sulfate transporter CysZ [Thiohalobacter]BAZ94150.1 uncharacterized protein FOKN1_1764 [Thiohalobacter thiocyanaticus]BCO30795.1 sulfate transporter CysZ [Thiohalobacter sp. COW1]